MKQKRKYRKRQKTTAAKGENPQRITGEIKSLIGELVTSHTNALLAIREDLIRTRARIKERQTEDHG